MFKYLMKLKNYLCQINHNATQTIGTFIFSVFDSSFLGNNFMVAFLLVFFVLDAFVEVLSTLIHEKMDEIKSKMKLK